MIPDTWSLMIDEEIEAPVVVVRGELTTDDLKQFLSVVRNVPAYQDHDTFLWDLRHVTEFPSTSEIRSFAKFIKLDTTRASRAAIIVNREVHFGLTRMFATLSEQPGVARRVFWDCEQARAWLAEAELSVEPYLAQSWSVALYPAD